MASPLFQVDQPANIGILRHSGMSLTANLSTAILPRLVSGTRTFLAICNDGGVDVYLALGANASLNNGFFLASGDKIVLQFPFVWSDTINAIASATGHVCWIEGIL